MIISFLINSLRLGNDCGFGTVHLYAFFYHCAGELKSGLMVSTDSITQGVESCTDFVLCKIAQY